MYKNGFSRRHPGLVLFLVSQSCLMEDSVSGKDYSLAQMVSDAINGIMNMFMFENIWGECIKNTTFFMS